MISLRVGKKDLVLKKVYYVPGISANLVSISNQCQEFEVEFGLNNFVIKKQRGANEKMGKKWCKITVTTQSLIIK
jgi:hypothetical protein